MNDERKVELRLAYEWTCPECGRDHFERAIIAEFSEAEMNSMREEHGIEADDEGEFMSHPDDVYCPDCGHRFQTDSYRES